VQEVQVAGSNGVAADVVAAVLNVTATDTRAPGFVTVFPCGTAVPDASNVNYTTGQAIANAVTVPVGANGKVCFYTSATIHLIVDINGAYTNVS
jgi:serine protease